MANVPVEGHLWVRPPAGRAIAAVMVRNWPPGTRRGPYRLHGYVLLLTTGIRPAEARALRWDLVDLEAGTVAG